MSAGSARVSAKTDTADIAPIETLAGPVPVWAFSASGLKGARGFNGDRDFPGPVVEFLQGAPATLALSNESSLNHSIHLYGLDVRAAKYAATRGLAGVPPAGNEGYQFTAPFAGTYFYHCNVDAPLHMEMGMYGAVIVRPASGATNLAWDGGPSFDREYIWQLHTFDTRWHRAEKTGPGTLRYRPNVFMINGRDGTAPLVDPATAIRAPTESKVLLRLISYGQMPALVDLGGVPFEVIASDGRPLKQAPLKGRGALRISPGERYDLLLSLPASAGPRHARVTYLNIRGTDAVGAVRTTITAT